MIEEEEGRDDSRDAADGGDAGDAALPGVPLPIAGIPVAGLLGGGATGALNPMTTGVVPATGAAGAFAVFGTAAVTGDADGAIAERVEAALAQDGRLTAVSVAVEVTEGTVTLSGEVVTERERQDAEAACARVAGVRAVNNRLTVAGAEE